MTIDETIAQAAEKFGVSRDNILAGRKCRNAHVLCAREWIVGQFPDMSANALSKAMRYANHSSILAVRKRLADSISNNSTAVLRD